MNNTQGLENAPKIMQDFVVSLDKKEQAKMQSFILKHNKSIIKVLKPVYDLSVYFIIGSIFVASMVEVYYYA